MAKMTVVGEAGFNNLREARGFKGEETNKTYGIDVILTLQEADALVKATAPIIEKLHAEKVESEKAKGRKVLVSKPLSLKDTPDGKLRITFKRKEDDKAPMVVGKDREPYQSFLKRGSRVKVAFDLVPYVMQGVFGVSMKLIGVQVLEEELSPDDLSALFGGDEAPETKPKTEPKDLF